MKSRLSLASYDRERRDCNESGRPWGQEGGFEVEVGVSLGLRERRRELFGWKGGGLYMSLRL